MTTQDEFAQPAQQRSTRDTEAARAGRGAEYRLRPHRHVGGPFSGERPDRPARLNGDGHPPETRAGAGGVDHRTRPTLRAAGASTDAGAGGSDRAGAVLDRVSRLERRLAASVRRGSVPALRIALSLVFIWFGALKVTGETPVGKLVGGVAPWLPQGPFVSGLGVFEVLLGVALLIGYRVVWVALLMIAHLAGTFLVFLTEPGAAFLHGNPLLVTMAGEFVAKNMVLIAAGLVLVAFAHERPGSLEPAPLPERA
jgi:uncharacterized membrane protein YkgB